MAGKSVPVVWCPLLLTTAVNQLFAWRLRVRLWGKLRMRAYIVAAVTLGGLLVEIGCARPSEPKAENGLPVAVATRGAPGTDQATSADRDDQMHRIETRRFVLRPFTADDWRDFQELGVDWAAAPGPAFDKWPTSEAACRESVEYMSKQDKWFAMCLRESGKVVGLLAINYINEEKQADVGHVILSKYHDNDHDKEALQAIIQYCFDVRGVLSIITYNAPEHTAQIAPLRSLGFVNTNRENPGELVLTRAQWEQQR